MVQGWRLLARTKWLGVVATIAAVGIFWAAVSTHLHRACTVFDTPYLDLCRDVPREVASLRLDLREEIRRNPGDSVAWLQLLAVGKQDASSEVLKAATTLAPHHLTVLRSRAEQALAAGRLEEAVPLLVQILKRRYSPDAARNLAHMLRTPKGIELMQLHLDDAESWLPSVLASVIELKVPPSFALPLVVGALERGSFPDATRRAYMRSLKNSGEWLDAYGLWLAYHRQVVPLLYNSGFDEAFDQDGFDWEFSRSPRSKAGVVVEQHAVARRGFVLEIDFTGRAFSSPILQQYVFAAPGAYRLRGEYMASKLRSEGGLTWVAKCTSGRKATAGKSSPLQDTGGVWKPMSMEFNVPDDCGPVASIQLEPAAPFEAAAGMRGTVAFDGFSLTRSAN
jgi:hypothetical protein